MIDSTADNTSGSLVALPLPPTIEGPPPLQSSEPAGLEGPPPPHESQDPASSHMVSKHAQAFINPEDIRSPTPQITPVDILGSSTGLADVSLDLMHATTQEIDVRVTTIQDDGDFMDVTQLLPVFKIEEIGKDRPSDITSTPGSSKHTRPETATIEQINNESFIDSIFDTGLLPDLTRITPPYARTPHATPSTSPVMCSHDISPNHIRLMFEQTAQAGTLVQHDSVQFELEDISMTQNPFLDDQDIDKASLTPFLIFLTLI